MDVSKDDSITFIAMDSYEMAYPGSRILDEADGLWILAFRMDGDYLPKDPGFISVPIWRMLIHESGGRSIISVLFGFDLNLLTDPIAGFSAALAVNVWLAAPLAAFTFYAALSRLPRAALESAAMDGASGWTMTRWIHFPQVRSTVFIMGALELVKAFKEFNVPFLMTADASATLTPRPGEAIGKNCPGPVGRAQGRNLAGCGSIRRGRAIYHHLAGLTRTDTGAPFRPGSRRRHDGGLPLRLKRLPGTPGIPVRRQPVYHRHQAPFLGGQRRFG